MSRRSERLLTVIVSLQAVCLMVMGYIMQQGLIDWPRFGRRSVMALVLGAVFIPFFRWIHERRLGKRAPWSTTLIFVTVLFSGPLASYWEPHTNGRATDIRGYLLQLCLLFAMAAPILAFGVSEKER